MRDKVQIYPLSYFFTGAGVLAGASLLAGTAELAAASVFFFLAVFLCDLVVVVLVVSVGLSANSAVAPTISDIPSIKVINCFI